MSSEPAPSPEILRSHEAAFIEHYSWLIRWALQLTNNDRARAEDLVQEVFAQLAFRHTNLSAVRNVQAYLYTTLRNIHVSELRIAGRTHIQVPSIVEYNLAATALSASNPHDLYQTQDQLRRICYYACVRKQSSRAGSVMILRFFFGYHISEVAQVLGGTTQAVRQCLRFARSEARVFLDDPGALAFMDRTTLKTSSPSGACGAEELLAELRLAIFRSRQGDCLDSELFNAFYKKGLILAADNSTLAHVVSCRRCLDCANRVLNLALLSERHPADALGPDNSSRGGPGSSGGSGGTSRPVRLRRRFNHTEAEISTSFLSRCRRRATELFEHHPRELCVSVNGHMLGSQWVNSEISRLRLDITIPEPLNFIEVLSEENARLLVMPIEAPPDGEPTQTLHVVLSEGRHIQVTLRHGHPWPMLEVVYEDPNFTADSQLSVSNMEGVSGRNGEKDSSSLPVGIESGEGIDQLQASPLKSKPRPTLVSSASTSFEGAAQVGSVKTPAGLVTSFGRKNFAQCWRLVISPLKQKLAALQIASRTVHRNAESTWARLKFSRKKTEVEGLFNLSRSVSPLSKPRWSIPVFITAILSILLIAVLLLVRLNITPTVSAASLIARAGAAEETLNGEAGRAVHRVIDLEERARAGGKLIARSRIEIWRDAGQDLTVRRVYDDKGRLVAGEWASKQAERTAVTSRTIYHRGDPPRVESSVRNPQTAIRNLELWQLEPSARVFAEIIVNVDAASVSEDSSVYIIRYAGKQGAVSGIPLEATLILRKSDLHPVEQTLVVQRGTELHEYRFAEASFERPPVSAVAPAVFRPDPELISEGAKAEVTRMKRDASFQPPSFALQPPVATPEFEVEVAYVLDRFRARFGDQISLLRTPEGGLVVKGIVDTGKTREEILRALSPVINNPALTVQIDTVAEVLARPQQQRTDRVTSHEFGSENAIPVYEELQRYFSQSSLEHDRVDQAVREFAARVVGRSRRVLSHAIELKQLKERFSAGQLAALTPDAKIKWLGMVRKHAEALRRETVALRQELAPIFFANYGAGGDTRGVEVSTEADLTIAIERLYKSATAIDEIVRSVFSASSEPAAPTVLKSPHFRVSLITAEELAGRIGRVEL
jgi:RNA polymerase sigma factor (sigma-70 family)